MKTYIIIITVFRLLNMNMCAESEGGEQKESIRVNWMFLLGENETCREDCSPMQRVPHVFTSSLVPSMILLTGPIGRLASNVIWLSAPIWFSQLRSGVLANTALGIVRIMLSLQKNCFLHDRHCAVEIPISLRYPLDQWSSGHKGAPAEQRKHHKRKTNLSQ